MSFTSSKLNLALPLMATLLAYGCTKDDPSEDDSSGGTAGSSVAGASSGSAGKAGGASGASGGGGASGAVNEGGGEAGMSGEGGQAGEPAHGGSGGENDAGGAAGEGGGGGQSPAAGAGGDGSGGEGGDNSTPVPPGGEREVLWHEDFEEGDADWNVEGGDWAIGAPVSGSNAAAAARPLAHGGDNCAGTGVSGNYGNDRDSRLVGPEITIPAASERPRLRYWYWNYFQGAGDYAELQIRVDGGAWQTIETFTHTERAWAQQIVDLGVYAGRSVEVGFHLITDASTGASGVFIDDITIETGALALENPEDFDAGFGDWSVEGGEWSIGAPVSGSNGASAARPLAHSGDNAAGTGVGEAYEDNADARLVSPEFIVPVAEDEPALRYYAWSLLGADAYGQLQIRVVGDDWADLADGRVDATNRAWAPRENDLSAYSGKLVQVAFHFVAPMASGYSGLFIDDVSLETK